MILRQYGLAMCNVAISWLCFDNIQCYVGGDQQNLLTNYIFLKVVINNICDAFGTNNFIQQINILSAFYSIKKRIFWYIYIYIYIYTGCSKTMGRKFVEWLMTPK